MTLKMSNLPFQFQWRLKTIVLVELQQEMMSWVGIFLEQPEVVSQMIMLHYLQKVQQQPNDVIRLHKQCGFNTKRCSGQGWKPRKVQRRKIQVKGLRVTSLTMSRAYMRKYKQDSTTI